MFKRRKVEECDESLYLLNEMHNAIKEYHLALNHEDYADPDFLDAAIAEVNCAKLKLSSLILRCRSLGISCDKEDILKSLVS